MTKFPGVVIGLVINTNDPEGEGRVQLEFPWMPGSLHSSWAPIAAPMAGPSRGQFYSPEVGDEALVAFEHGDFDHPFVVGFLWNGVDQPPSNDHHRRLVHSVNGHEIEINDSPPNAGDKGFIRIQDAHGNKIELSNGRISITGVS